MGNRFERLILGILNELAPIAKQSSIFKDVHEWTDLTCRNDVTKKTVPIQVKFIRNIHQNDEAIATHSRCGKIIMISPVEIARYMEATYGKDPLSAEWLGFLGLFPRLPHSPFGLSSGIFWLLASILTSNPSHPLDPVQRVPLVLRNAVRTMASGESWQLDY